MANPNPDATRARLAKRAKNRPKAGTVNQLQGVMWSAILKLERHLDAVTDTSEDRNAGELCRLTHALSQAASVYLKALEIGEFEKRLEALEEEISKQ